jgi:hypothetical protein
VSRVSETSIEPMDYFSGQISYESVAMVLDATSEK